MCEMLQWLNAPSSPVLGAGMTLSTALQPLLYLLPVRKFLLSPTVTTWRHCGARGSVLPVLAPAVQLAS